MQRDMFMLAGIVFTVLSLLAMICIMAVLNPMPGSRIERDPTLAPGYIVMASIVCVLSCACALGFIHLALRGADDKSRQS